MRRFIQQLKSRFGKDGDGSLANTSLYYKVLVILCLVFVTTVSIIAFQLEKKTEQMHLQVTKEELKSLATMVALNVNGDLVEYLRKPEQEHTGQYRNLQNFLLSMMRANRKIDDIYIMRKSIRSSQLSFVVNAYATGKDHIHLGVPYEVNQAPDMLQGFVGPAVDQKITVDQWGEMLSGYAPVKNSQGNVVGIIGIDYTADDIRNERINRSWHILIYLLFGMILMLAIGFMLVKKLVGRLHNIKNALDMLLEERLDVLVQDSGHDEIKLLASGVNKLIKKTVVNREQILIHSTTGLVNALEARDVYTHGHSSEVALITNDIMKELGLESEQQFVIGFAAILHDVGKIGIPDPILHKPGKLTDEEFAVIKQHPVIGQKILEGIPSLDEISDIVRHHHERYDGKGYPDRLSGEQIHIGARIITVADSFQAMISDRPYRKGMEQAVALQELERNMGTQFDPAIARVFLAICQTKNYKN